MMFPDHVTVNSSMLLNGFKDLTIDVRYTGPVRLRLWVALRLVRFAGWLVGGKVRAEPE